VRLFPFSRTSRSIDAMQLKLLATSIEHHDDTESNYNTAITGEDSSGVNQSIESSVDRRPVELVLQLVLPA